MTDAELRGLLADCLKLWGVQARIDADGAAVMIATAGGVFTVVRADAALRPARWFYQTPERSAAGRRPRAAPSVVALLSGLRNAMAELAA